MAGLRQTCLQGGPWTGVWGPGFGGCAHHSFMYKRLTEPRLSVQTMRSMLNTPSAQPPGPSELRGSCRPSHPPRNGLPLACGARTGVPPGMVAGSVSPSGSMGSGHLHLPLPPAPGHVATGGWIASVPAGPAGGGVRSGQDRTLGRGWPGWHLGLLWRKMGPAGPGRRALPRLHHPGVAPCSLLAPLGEIRWRRDRLPTPVFLSNWCFVMT